MKSQQLIMLGVAGVAVYLIMKSNRLEAANQVNNLGKPVFGISEIFSGAAKGSAAYGWRYFTDGTAISPTGVYYRDGVQVWAPN